MMDFSRALAETRLRLQRIRHARRAVVLAYHRIALLDSDPFSLCVQPRHFGEHLEVLAEYGRLRFSEVPDALERQETPYESVCITFDDGYADNLHAAAPLLERFDWPATVFITTAQLHATREYWWDEFEQLVLTPNALPVEPLPHELGITHTGAWKSRRALFDALHSVLDAASASERSAMLAALRRWTGRDTDIRPTHVVLSEEQLTTLAGMPLIEVGAHTVTHPKLDVLPVAEQRAELAASKRHLEALLGRTVTSVAYPHGRYSETTMSQAKDAGYSRGCSVVARPVGSRTNPLALPRFLVRDMDGDAFAKALRQWFGRPPGRDAI